MGEDFSLADWQTSGLDTHSTTEELEMSFDPESQSFDCSSATDVVMRVPRDELLSVDYFGRLYSGDEVPVGPFTEGWSPVRRRLRLA